MPKINVVMSDKARTMQAKDVMRRRVVSVRPDTPVHEIARTLVDNRISAAPVIDLAGKLVGMVSEGDLIGSRPPQTDARRDWWLAQLAEGEALSAEFLASIAPKRQTAQQMMSAPVVTIDETTPVSEIARLLCEHRIKRVPVVADGHVVGIVSRADLVCAMAKGLLTG